MNILVVCKYLPGFKEGVAPFNETMISSLRELGHNVEIYPIIFKGILGYLFHIFLLNKLLFKKNNIDLIHGIGGLSGLVTFFQPFKPSLVTFTGSDINIYRERIIFKLFIISNKRISIFVSKKLLELAGNPAKSKIIPLGIDLSGFFPLEKDICKSMLHMDVNINYILFGSRYDRPEKNPKLVQDAIQMVDNSSLQLLEFKGIKETDLNYLYNAVDVLVLTSYHEGSPTVIKEAMACNCPIVATDVGDIKEIINNTEGCFLTSFNPTDVAAKLELALKYSREKGRTSGRIRFIELGLDSKTVAIKLLDTYNEILNKVSPGKKTSAH